MLHSKPRASVELPADGAPTLSTYFPAGTQYFYGYPAGEASGFLNNVPPEVEELVAARAFSCAGANVSVIAFAATSSPAVPTELLGALGIPQLPADRTILLPSAIDRSLKGNARNDAVRNALEHCTQDGKLIMAQPFSDDSLRSHYQLDPELSMWVNDKNNLDKYIDTSMLPERLGVFSSGEAFGAKAASLTLPFVVKVSSSSSGDGVYICRTKHDLQTTIKQVKDVASTLLVEQFITVKKNYGVHFGIPSDKRANIDILGVNEQVTTPEGEFLGGIIKDGPLPPRLEPIMTYLRYDVLPRIRAKGWYGIGGFDVLIDEHDRSYFIDCNFRMTGMSAYHFLVDNHKIKAPLVSFSGVFVGTQSDFEECILPIAAKGTRNRKLQLISLTHHEDEWRFNAALLLNRKTPATEQISAILARGIQSAGLEQLAVCAPEDL